MRNIFRTLYIIPVLIVVLMAACSAPEEPAPANNNNATPQATENQPSQPTILTTPVTPEPSSVSAQPPAKLPEPTVANGKAPTNQPAGGAQPKLFVPKTVIDFGKQPKEKSLARTFVIKNTGSAELKIDAVEPS